MTGGWLFLKNKKFEQPIVARLNRTTSDTRLTKDTRSRTNRDGPLLRTESSSNDRILSLAIIGVAPFERGVCPNSLKEMVGSQWFNRDALDGGPARRPASVWTSTICMPPDRSGVAGGAGSRDRDVGDLHARNDILTPSTGGDR